MSDSTPFPAVLPKMNLQKNGNSISASIQETNRVRKLLGMKPLTEDTSSKNPSSTSNEETQSNSNSAFQNFPEKIPEMKLQKNGNSISASVEETNRIRKLLGLKPLNENSPKKQPQNANISTSKLSKSTKKTAKLLHKIKENQLRRLAHQQIRGISLGEQLKNESIENFSSVHWVKKSREQQRRMEEKKLKNIISHDSDEEEDDIDDKILLQSLKGKHVRHNMSEFTSGETVIAILKDRPILKSTMELNISDDELIVPELMEKNILKRNEIRKKNARKYNPYSDENIIHCGMNESDRDFMLLSKYNEEEFGKVGHVKHGFQLNEFGNIDRNSQILESFEKPVKKMIEDSLQDVGKRISTDFYTDHEMKSLFKKKRRKRKKNENEKNKNENEKSKKRKMSNIENKKKIKKRKLNSEIAEDKYSYLDNEDSDDENVVHLNRNPSQTKQEEKQRRYELALQRANAKLNENLQSFYHLDNEQDFQFKQSLMRAQKLIEKRNKKEEYNVENYIQLLEKEEKVNENESKDKGLLFTSAVQFSNGLIGAVVEMNEENIAREQMFNNYISNDMNSSKIDGKIDDEEDYNQLLEETEHGGWIEADANRSKNRKKSKNKMKKLTSVNNAVLDAEPLVSTSITDTLKHIRRRGYLSDEEFDSIAGGNKNHHFRPIDIEKHGKEKAEYLRWDKLRVSEWLRNIGLRNYEKVFLKHNIHGLQLSQLSIPYCHNICGMIRVDCDLLFQELANLKGDPAPDIRLPYLDRDGRPMSAKEAFRELSHRFHGKKSGPRKQEKRLNKRQMQLQRKKRKGVDTPLGTLTRLKETTASTGKPFVRFDT